MKHTPIELEKDLIQIQRKHIKDLSLWSKLLKPILTNDKIKVSNYILYINDTEFGEDYSVLSDVPRADLIKVLSKYDTIIFYTGTKCQLNGLLSAAYSTEGKNVVIVKTLNSRWGDWLDFKDFEVRNKQGERLDAIYFCD